FSMRAIARDMNIAHSTVVRLIKKATETGKIEDLKRSGRPRILTQEDEERKIELINSGECETATEVHSKFREYFNSKEKQKLWERVIEIWNEIGWNTINKLYESMSKRIAAIIEAKGGYTEY
ncbi:24459_t:CDS:2, partial [Cetraspora pellucida]